MSHLPGEIKKTSLEEIVKRLKAGEGAGEIVSSRKKARATAGRPKITDLKVGQVQPYDAGGQ